MKTDRSKIPNLDAVYPWFYETRPDKAKEYGIPFGGGTCMLLIRKKPRHRARHAGACCGMTGSPARSPPTVRPGGGRCRFPP